MENQILPRILGWDASGKVIAVGAHCTLFREGDDVYYAGTIARPGTNSEYHLEAERIVERKPKTLSFEEAAAMPLTTITAWEALFDRLSLLEDISTKTTHTTKTITSTVPNVLLLTLTKSIIIIFSLLVVQEE